MKNFLLKLILTAVAVLLTSYLLPGVSISNFLVAILVAFVLALLNAILKPLFIILTIPITILTLGLFLLVINAILIMITDAIVPGFAVSNFWWALLFSLILSLINSILEGLTKESA